jgi:hypothetical protein
MRKIWLVAAVALTTATPAENAQSGGWHFGSWSEGPIAAFTPQPNDACQRKEMSSPGMLTYLNAEIGQPYGPSARVVRIQGLHGYPGATGGYLSCQGTIVLESGAQEIGTLSVQDPGGNAPVQVNWESEAAKAKRLDSPEKGAITKFCATATPRGCALYVRKISGCRPLASTAYSVLATQRLWRSKGSSPEEAAQLSIDAIASGNVSASPRDLAVIVKRAQGTNGTTPLQEFSEQILNECTVSASK